MRYLESMFLSLFPDFSNIPEEILKNKKSIYDLIGINEKEKNFIERYYKIKYNYF
jgi:hypothetical protein